MSSVVRSSKYRHVFGQPAKKDKCFDALKVSRKNGDTNGAAASSQHVAVCWESGGGGAFCVMSQSETGRITKPALFQGHKSAVLDLAFNPFQESLIASASDDCTLKLWSIPESLTPDHGSEAVQTLDGHLKKVIGLAFNPLASNVLASFSADRTVKIWDVESGTAKVNIDTFGDQVHCCDWDKNGDLLVATCKDKKLRVADGRNGEIVQEAPGFGGNKVSRVTWLKKRERLFVAGFTRSAERAIRIYDPRKIEEPMKEIEIDTSNGVLMPFYDEDTEVMFLAGKGDGNIRYFEMADKDPYAFFLSAYGSKSPQKGMCALPKLAVNVQGCEIMRLFKLTDTMIEPISMIVPRKSDAFQPDIYPDSWVNEPILSADQFFGGEKGERKTMSMEDIFKGTVTIGSSKHSGFQKKASPLEVATERVKEVEAENEELKAKVAELTAKLAKLES